MLFLTATAGIVVGRPLAYLLLGWMVPVELGDQARKGLAALAGSWIGDGANFVAIGESVGATSSTTSMMVIADVAVANAWMALLLYFAGRDRRAPRSVRTQSFARSCRPQHWWPSGRSGCSFTP